MIELVATLVVIAIMLGVVWRIYYCWRNEELLALVDNVEAQLRRLRPPPPPSQPTWMDRRFGPLWWDELWDTIGACALIGVFRGVVHVRTHSGGRPRGFSH